MNIMETNKDTVKSTYLLADVHWAIGIKQEKIEDIVVIPYIFNADKTKIKIISNDKVYRIINGSVNETLSKRFKMHVYRTVSGKDFFKVARVSKQQVSRCDKVIANHYLRKSLTAVEDKTIEEEEYKNF